MCFRSCKLRDGPLPPMFRSLVLLLSLRPILGDLHHGNNNLLILFLIVAMFYAWRQGYDVLAGLLLGLAISYKVTPALFFVYFAYKRSWRTVGWGMLGMGIFLLVVPSAVDRPRVQRRCLGMWWHRMVTPFVVEGRTSPQEINQSMAGVLTRLLTDDSSGNGRYDIHLDVNIVVAGRRRSSATWSRAHARARRSAGVLLPDPDRRIARDPRLLGEVALVVLTMLFVSERSWKHHYVTLLLPTRYLVWELYFPACGPRLGR